MAGDDGEFEEEQIDLDGSPEDIAASQNELARRCKAAGMAFEQVEIAPGETRLKVDMKCGRDVRPLFLASQSVENFLSVPFENYIFLSGLEAICSYTDGTLEAGLRPAGTGIAPLSQVFRRIFGLGMFGEEPEIESAKIALTAAHTGLPDIEIGRASDVFLKLSRTPNRFRLTLRLTGCHVATHDAALALLNKAAGSVLFQLDLLADAALVLERERKRTPFGRRAKRLSPGPADLQYPNTQFDSAPLSLYWYGRSASGMPLLQFLAFYQVIEFYFPIYSQSEAQRRLKSLLKDPTFRNDRDADVAKLLAAIHVSRSGAFGDERSQLRATLNECVDAEALRAYLEEDESRKNFFLIKSKSLPYHRVPLANKTADLRNDVADRIYDIRCKIVHTKTDYRDDNVEFLLPFTHEAEQLSDDIELVQYIAQVALVFSSAPFNVHA